MGLTAPDRTVISQSAEHYNRMLDPWLKALEVDLARAKVFGRFGRIGANPPPKAPIPAGEERIEAGRFLHRHRVHPLLEDR